MAEKKFKKNNTFDINRIPEGKIPPQSPDIERAVLGAILLERTAFSRVIEVLNDEIFYAESHRKIFAVMKELFTKSSPIDLITVTELLRAKGWVEEVGGAFYIAELTNSVTSAANVEAHAHIIVEKALLRGIISASSEMMTRAFADNEDTLTLLDETESMIFSLSERKMKKSYIGIDTAIMQIQRKIDSMRESPDGLIGVPSGFQVLDNLTGGFKNSDLVIIAGRPSQGKTALAMTIARNAALHKKKSVPVAVFSLEMATEQLILRLLSSESRINSHHIQHSRKLSTQQLKDLSRAAGLLHDAPIFIDDSGGINILELRAKSRRLKAEHNIGLIVIDYLQLIHASERIESREQQISLISRSLKALAKELDIPVIALSQLNRASESRTDKRPQLSDLRESGAIEQDADLVIIVHRPEFYNIETITDRDGGKIPAGGKAQIIIAKHRNGPTDELLLAFEKQFASFTNIDEFQNAQLIPTHILEREPSAPF
ncbi:MAG: replicative DNA helicase [Bacteroidota bacterium]